MVAGAGEAPHPHRLFAPLLSQARKQLRSQAGTSLYNLLSDSAHAGWEEYLCLRLYSASVQVTTQQFRHRCSVRSAFVNTRDDQQPNGRSAYDEFVGKDPGKWLQETLSEFPGLAGIVQVLINNWVEMVSEFLGHLSIDLQELTVRLMDKSLVCPVKGVHAGLSDAHRGGRCVARVEFQDSVTLIYKPRSLAPECHFFSFLEQLNSEDIPYSLRGVWCWDCGEYGWMEHVASQPCRRPADLQAFYWRAGALLALIYLSRGVDMHKENLLAAGAYPMLIDLETLWHPQEHLGMSSHPATETVLRTGFLPLPNSSPGATYHWSALCHETLPASQTSPHLPVLAGIVYPASNFIPDILAGFRWIGRQTFKDGRVTDEFQLYAQALARCRRRRILRSTSWYQSVIERMVTPSSLRDSASFAAECHNKSQGGPAMNEQECSALLQMDIPYIEQCTETGRDEEAMLPILDVMSFERQEAIIGDALQRQQRAKPDHPEATICW